MSEIIKRLVFFSAVLLVLVFYALMWLFYRWLSSPLTYPERGVLYRVSDRYSLTALGNGLSLLDSIATIHVGPPERSKEKEELPSFQLSLLGTSKRREKGDLREYDLHDSSYRKILYVVSKVEKSHEIIEIGRKEFVEITGHYGDNSQEKDRTVLVVRELDREFTKTRFSEILLEDTAAIFMPVMRLEMDRRFRGFFGNSLMFATRLFFAGRKTVFSGEKEYSDPFFESRETGWAGIFPQSSTVRITVPSRNINVQKFSYGEGDRSAHDTSLNDRTGDREVFSYSYKVKQFYDFFPWRYVNGGYSIIDSAGELARIEIEDFWFHYGDDHVYRYYIDRNGNGVIEPPDELAGRVLFDKIGKDEVEASLSGEENLLYNNVYSFMEGANSGRAEEDFILCGDVEALMPDQIYDGFGRFSYLGYIEEKRDDIILLKEKSVKNLYRAISTDDALGMLDSLSRLLTATNRKEAPVFRKFSENLLSGDTRN